MTWKDEVTYMGIFTWIIFGALAGWLASIITGDNKRMGAFANIAVGIVGSMIGGFIMDFFGGNGVTGFNFRSLIVAIVGSVILLWIVNKIRK